MTVWIYVDTRKQVGDKDHLKVFADQDAARKWFGEHDREGVAFEYPVQGNESACARSEVAESISESA
jgi:hypothetical protein